jgi:hypothetical protein
MEKNNVVFSAENIISTLGINLNDDYNVIFEPDPQAIDITSRFFIESKSNPYSGFFIASDNFENSRTPGYIASLPTILTRDGVVTLKLDMNLPEMTKIMKLVNDYVQFFMVITERKGFYVNETIRLEIMTDYKYTDVLLLTNVELFNFILYSPFETNYKNKEISVEDEVNTYLAKLGVDKIDTNTDVAALMVLVKMQKTLEAMVAI